MILSNASASRASKSLPARLAPSLRPFTPGVPASAQYVKDVVKLPEKNIFVDEVLYFSQIRDAKGNVGDRAVIERFSKSPKKVIYVDPDFKTAVINSKENVFDYGFIVDVEVSMITGKVAAYRVLKYHERFKVEDE